jgi:two-component system OmpR family sensor kinase
VPIERLVEEALAAFEVLRMGAPVDLHLDLEPGLEVTGDLPTLVQVLGNLLGNAWKYAPLENRKIEIMARGDRRHVMLDVADNGPGVPEEERRRIFDEFERGRAATASRAGGHGLGLAIVRAIVRVHGGHVDLIDTNGGGARFRVTLPRRPPSRLALRGAAEAKP